MISIDHAASDVVEFESNAENRPIEIIEIIHEAAAGNAQAVPQAVIEIESDMEEVVVDIDVDAAIGVHTGADYEDIVDSDRSGNQAKCAGALHAAGSL